MWTYEQKTGKLSHNGVEVVDGYSGFGPCKNDPGSERIVNQGPIPRGRYDIGGRYDSETHGPVVLPLHPVPGTETFGRGGFLIHGDAIEHPGAASHGCIILPRAVRIAISGSLDTALEVV